MTRHANDFPFKHKGKETTVKEYAKEALNEYLSKFARDVLDTVDFDKSVSMKVREEIFHEINRLCMRLRSVFKHVK